MIKTPEDMIAGTKYVTKNYGALEIVEYVNHTQVISRFVDTGYECTSRADCIRNGQVKDRLLPNVCGVGFIGVGKYSPTNTPKLYDAWAHMIKRCYSEKEQLKTPTYIDCSVSPVWHNLQLFGEWYEVNYPKDGGDYQLDKDIKVPGNRVYSPETCMFVTQEENVIAAIAKSYVFLSPDNERVEIYNMNAFCRESDLNPGHMIAVSKGNRPHHKGWRTSK